MNCSQLHLLPDAEMSPQTPVVLSYGMGVDSTAILLRWIFEPGSRNFDLGDLTVITAMTGDEWPRTGQLVTAHILPLLAGNGIRYAQVARATGSQSDGCWSCRTPLHPPSSISVAGTGCPTS